MSHDGLLPCHTDHRDAIAIIVVVRHRSDDDKARPGKTLSRSDDVVKGARLGPCQDPQLGEIWHHDIGVLNRILHQGHGLVWDVGSELAVWSHVCHDGVTDPYRVAVVGTALLYGSQHRWPGTWCEVSGQHRVNMFEFAIGVKGVDHGVDLLGIDGDTSDAGTSVVIGQQRCRHPPGAHSHSSHHGNSDAVADGSLDDVGLQR